MDFQVHQTEDNVDVQDDDLAVIEAEYDKEVLKLTKDFTSDLNNLKSTVPEESKTEPSGCEYLRQIEILKTNFEKKWIDLEKR